MSQPLIDPTVRIQTTQYTISCIPEANIDRHAFELMVEYRGNQRWAVVWHGMCLSKDGQWDYEPSPSSREDDWLGERRFTEQKALQLACEWAPKLKCNGITVTEALARHHTINGDNQ